MNHDKAQEQRLDYLLRAFKEDSVRYRDLEVADDYQEKRMTLRSLMNIRMPGEMPEETVKVQDEFLAREAVEKGIVPFQEIPTAARQYGSSSPLGEKISIWQGDITRLKAGAIVNAANSQMLGCFVPCHRCIDNAIHSAAGIQLRRECSSYMKHRKIQYGPRYEEPVGQAVLTKGFNLPAEYVIHTVGPVVTGSLNETLREELRSCYKSVLECCVEHGISSVAFCCISTGEFHFPNQEAARIAVRTVSEYLKTHGDSFERIIFNVFKDMDRVLYEQEIVNL